MKQFDLKQQIGLKKQLGQPLAQAERALRYHIGKIPITDPSKKRANSAQILENLQGEKPGRPTYQNKKQVRNKHLNLICQMPRQIGSS